MINYISFFWGPKDAILDAGLCQNKLLTSLAKKIGGAACRVIPAVALKKEHVDIFYDVYIYLEKI